jgi:hypothetical protein
MEKPRQVLLLQFSTRCLSPVCSLPRLLTYILVGERQCQTLECQVQDEPGVGLVQDEVLAIRDRRGLSQGQGREGR